MVFKSPPLKIVKMKNEQEIINLLMEYVGNKSERDVSVDNSGRDVSVDNSGSMRKGVRYYEEEELRHLIECFFSFFNEGVKQGDDFFKYLEELNVRDRRKEEVEFEEKVKLLVMKEREGVKCKGDDDDILDEIVNKMVSNYCKFF